jgi:hypothetical protein
MRTLIACCVVATLAVACGGSPKPAPVANAGAGTGNAAITMEPAEIRGNPSGSQFRMEPSDSSAAAAVVEGAFGKETIELTFIRDTKVRTCYETALAKSPSLAGQSTATFVVGADGKVTSATAAGLDTTVDSCVADAIKTMAFPAPSAATTVTYPLKFTLTNM